MEDWQGMKDCGGAASGVPGGAAKGLGVGVAHLSLKEGLVKATQIMVTLRVPMPLMV